MNDKIGVDLTNKAVIDLADYTDLKVEIQRLQDEVEKEKTKYNEVINYLISECEVKQYNNGEYYLKYDYYHNHIGEYLTTREPYLVERYIKKHKEKDE